MPADLAVGTVFIFPPQDDGDTVGSVFRGFFSIGRRRDPVSRLPTSSTIVLSAGMNNNGCQI